jgi:hypothetical protein
MDDSSDGVTLFAGFISDLLESYVGNPYATGLFAIADGVDLGKPTSLVPMRAFNEMCDWIVRELGFCSLRKAGENLGRRVFDHMAAQGVVGPSSTPNEILTALKIGADTMIQDPKHRGWTILVNEPGRMVVRRTQSFHPILQEGLLKSLAERSNRIVYATVRYLHSVARGDAFDDYEVSWD